MRNGLIAALFFATFGAIGGGALAAEETASPPAPKGEAVATFAGGCFWCVESDFDTVPGVLRTISGYTGGLLIDPTYKQVSAGGSGHREAVRIFFDPKKVSYATLLEIFWRSVDPTDDGGQFCDRGQSYETAIYANSADQKRLAEASKGKLQRSGVLKTPIVTPIETAGPFYPAEDYHQDFYKKSPLRYKIYRYGCGRDSRIRKLWGKDAFRGITLH
jgi:peptide-methionine (S)-S-oxide reductase